MNRINHRIYIITLTLITIAIIVFLLFQGYSYYFVEFEERFFHGDHQMLKPSGNLGHAYGIFGSLFMIIGMATYMARKRFRSLSRLGVLKHWLEFHIFLCVSGPILILFHTSYKFGGIIAISFWSMVAVFLSGVIGRFIYIQIPRTIEGRELSMNEVKSMKLDISKVLKESTTLDEKSYHSIVNLMNRTEDFKARNLLLSYLYRRQEERVAIREIKSILKRNQLSKAKRKEILGIVKNDLSLSKRIARLRTMQNLFKYWHVAHLPFALVMLIIMVIHIIVTILFGYKWVF